MALNYATSCHIWGFSLMARKMGSQCWVLESVIAMKMSELFLGEVDREAASSRRVLAEVPTERNDWKPHKKSMPLGYLAALVATMPAWIAMMVDLDEMDINALEGAKFKPPVYRTAQELIAAHDANVAKAQASLSGTTDEHLLTPWKFMVSGQVVSELPRHISIRDAVFSHLAHHRGQLTVSLRLNDARVPAIYGPSADEGQF
jgi:uncharacterized damage-inducible protein DinB